jgi:hypothetical protein
MLFSVGNTGFYEFNRLSFGMVNSGTTFQRVMERAMGDLLLCECLVFVDDILVFSKTLRNILLG